MRQDFRKRTGYTAFTETHAIEPRAPQKTGKEGIGRRADQRTPCGVRGRQKQDGWRAFGASGVTVWITGQGYTGIFLNRKKNWDIAFPKDSGILFPVPDEDGLYQALQIRMDEEKAAGNICGFPVPDTRTGFRAGVLLRIWRHGWRGCGNRRRIKSVLCLVFQREAFYRDSRRGADGMSGIFSSRKRRKRASGVGVHGHGQMDAGGM